VKEIQIPELQSATGLLLSWLCHSQSRSFVVEWVALSDAWWSLD